MSLTLYYGSGSPYAWRAQLALEHKALPYELKVLSFAAGDTRKPEFLALNPRHRVPVLVDGDFVLWESHAIVQYLCERTPGQTLLPAEPRARADVQRWLFWSSAHLSPPLGALAFEKMWKKYISGGEPDPARVAEHERAFLTVAQVLDGHLANRTWLSGKALTLADFSITSALMYKDKLALPLEPYANLRGLLARVHELPAWKQTEPRW